MVSLGSGVFVFPATLRAVRSSGRSRPAMASLLMKAFFTPEELEAGNLSGKGPNRHSQLNPAIVGAIVGKRLLETEEPVVRATIITSFSPMTRSVSKIKSIA